MLKWVGTTLCVVMAVFWVVSGWWVIAYFGDGWFCMIDGGEFEYSPSNSCGAVGWGYGRSTQGFRLLMPRVGSIAPTPAFAEAPIYICPLWLLFIVIGIPTLVLWCISWWQHRSADRLIELAAQRRRWVPLIVCIGVSGLTLAVGLMFGFSDRDSLIVWCFVVVASGAGCLTARRRQLVTAATWALVLVAVYFIAAEVICDWMPGGMRTWANWYYQGLIRTVRLLAAGIVGAVCMVGYGLTLAITNSCTRLLAEAGRCTVCGYNLTGNVSGRCPECGEVI